MKGLLILSLALNCLLVSFVLNQDGSAHRRSRMEPMSALTSRTSPASPRRERAASPNVRYETPWQALEVKDYSSFISMLRAAHCPEETVRGLVALRVSKEYSKELLAQVEKNFQQEEWWHGVRSDSDSQRLHLLTMKLRRAMREEIEELLGVPFSQIAQSLVGWSPTKPQGWLPVERRAQLADLEERFQDEAAEIKSRGVGYRGILDEDQKADLAQLRKRERGELERLLTADELDENDARYSEAARYVLANLPQARDASEFKAMVKLAKPYLPSEPGK